jgi:hypothetical protein
MDELDKVTQALALTLGVAWASGINLYAAMLALGLMGATGHMTLPPGLEVLANPVVIAAAGFMYAIEFFADKIPGVDSAWDVVHTFIRIPAGAILAAEAATSIDPAMSIAAALLGGALAGSMHVTKAATRLLINASPEPFSNSIASLTEDAAVFGGIWMMTQHPNWFLVLLVVMLAGVVWAMPKLWRGVRSVFARVSAFVRGKGFARDVYAAAFPSGGGAAISGGGSAALPGGGGAASSPLARTGAAQSALRGADDDEERPTV